MTTYGFDALGRPCTPQQAARLGFRFVWHYLGAVTRTDVDAYHAAGVAVALFFERGQFDAGRGYLTGQQHALQAQGALAALGAPVGAAAAADYDPANPDEVAPYFQGWHDVLGPRAGGYGNFAVVEMLAGAGLCPAGLVQKVSGSPGGIGPFGWRDVTVSRRAHFLQHNDAVPPDAPRIPGQRLLYDYDVEQQLVASSPLLWLPQAVPDGPHPPPHPTPHPAPDEIGALVAALPVLKQGAAGQPVANLQGLLVAHRIGVGVIDGVFGPQTTAAVRNFQQLARVGVDGVVGPQTWRALVAA